MNFRAGLLIVFFSSRFVGFSIAHAQTQTAQVVDLRQYKSFVNRENCSKDQRHYLACISSLQILIGAVDPELNLKTQTTGIELLGLQQTKLALNANNLNVVSQESQAAFANYDTNVSALKQVFLRNQKTKADFRREFEPAYYHFKIANNDAISDVLNYLSQAYPDKLKEDLWVAAINEYLHVSVDPHSDWRVSEKTAADAESKATEFVGLGIRFVESPKGAAIESVVTGSGADAAGIEADDTVLSVNGSSLKGAGREFILAAIRGEENGVLNLKVLRDRQTFDVVAVRKKVITPVVRESIYRSGSKTVGMVRLENFTYKYVCEEVSEVLKKFNAAGVDQVLLDLRGNTGGAVSIAECLAGLFLGPGKVIAYQEGGGGGMLALIAKGPGSALDRAKRIVKNDTDQFIFEAGTALGEPDHQKYLATLQSPEVLAGLTREIELADNGLTAMYSRGEKIYDGKLAVLVDGLSASASELIAGAFRDLNRAVIVGQTTFGKGSFQSRGESFGRFQRWKTGGLFFQPSGSTNQTVGVKPHVEAYRALEPSVVETYQMREKELFLFPLEPRSIRHVVHDAGEMDTLRVSKECLRAKNVEAAYASTVEPPWKDMQVLTAVAALGCVVR